MREQMRQLKSGPAELRKFGLTVGSVLGVLGLVFLALGKFWHAWLWAPGLALGLSGWMRPRLLRWIYLAWMTAGLAVGHVVSSILLILIYYVAVTPLGWLARWRGRDFLERRWDGKASTYWHRRDPGKRRRPQDYERQY